MSGGTGIEVEGLSVRFGDVVAVKNVSFNVGAGELVTLLGPSGCGKTTTLRSIAGLEHPFEGTIRLIGKTVYSATERRNLPTERRGVSMVFQSYAIWPHMSVAQNVAYGLAVRRLPRAKIDQEVARALELVQMGKFAKRPSTKLSGGQQQRVAVARAIAFSPAVVLFDEPLSNLDARLRVEMRVELRELQRQLGITALYVTHDQEEALAISDHIIVMSDGHIEQMGTPEEIYARPRTRFVAEFVGSTNMISGHMVGSVDGNGTAIFTAAGGVAIRVHPPTPPSGCETVLALRTAWIRLSKGMTENKGNVISGSIHRRMFHGDFIQYLVSWPAGQLLVRRPPTDIFEEGTSVVISFDPENCTLF